MNDFNRHRREFDRDFRRMTAGIVMVWIAGIIFSLAFLGVIIWAIIQLVQWVTTK
jgi:hypothetical protein